MNRHRQTTSIKDRTVEFRSAVDLARRHGSPHTPAHRVVPQDSGRYHPRTEFTKLAANIGRDIEGTARKLERLATLAKRKTLFDDRPEEITALTTGVKQEIAVINQKIAALQRYSVDPTHRAPTNAQSKEHSANVIVFLQSKLASTSMDFKNILEVRSENIKASNTRKEQFMDTTARPSSHSTDQPPLYLTQRRTPRPAVEDTDDFVSLSVPDAAPGGSQEMLLVDQQDQYIDSRATAIQSIESTIAELGGIFQQLAHMVSEQRDMVQRIDSNVEDMEMNITGAQNELLRYYSFVSSNRWLMLKIFAIIIIFVTIFILVM
ncbi:Integral membrane protein SED5 [Dimargaris xerosporica]|nr:Integral membrane protein SED5 [Dimargaris xerosporica]